MSLRHFSELAKEEVNKMCTRGIDAIIDYAEEIGMSGLSHLGVHDLYTAIDNAVFSEWTKSKAAMSESRKKCDGQKEEEK